MGSRAAEPTSGRTGRGQAEVESYTHGAEGAFTPGATSFSFWDGGLSTLAASPPEPRARTVEFVAGAFVVRLEDGRALTVPLEWFPRLRDATPEQREHYELIGPGIGIHWPDIDEDVSVPRLFGLSC